MRIEDVQGIGATYAAKLVEGGMSTTDALNKAAKASRREAPADSTGISGKLILEWVNNADLMRNRGVGPDSDLPEAAGVDSPAELANRNAANLATTFAEVVAARPGVVRRIPTETEIAGWIASAKGLPKLVEH